MGGNSFGYSFSLVSFGESHGAAVGGVVEGCPSGVALDLDALQRLLDRRRPYGKVGGTARREEDTLQIVSGLFEGITTGAPIAFFVGNHDAASADYEDLKEVYRPSHADYAWEQRYGVRDYRGGGRSSAREHVARVVAGGIAMQILSSRGIRVSAYTSQIGDVKLTTSYSDLDLSLAETSATGCPDAVVSERMEQLLEEVKAEGDSIGGVVNGVIQGVPAGVGEPVFDRFQAVLAHAMLSINATKGFEFGSGFASATMSGSTHNDPFFSRDGEIHTQTNNSGGLQGGVSNGEDIYFRVAFKPISSIALPQQTVNREREEVSLCVSGRHDASAVMRAVPVVQAMAALVTLDLLLRSGKF